MHWYGLVHVARLRSTAIHSTSHPVVRRGPVPFLSFLVVVINSHMIVVLLLIALRIIIRQKVPIAPAVLVCFIDALEEKDGSQSGFRHVWFFRNI